MISVDGLSKHYEEKRALDDVSFEINPGTICGYLGPNGAGKSTTIKILTGLLTPTHGKARIAGFDVDDDPLEVKRRIGYVPENAAVYPTLTVSEFLNLIGTIHRMSPSMIKKRAASFLELFEVGQIGRQRLDSLSKGMRQKVVITAALLHEPEVLLFDEPLSGLDANATQTVKEVMQRMAERGATVFYCSHLLDIVERVCDRVIILNSGAVIADDTPQDLIANSKQATLEQAFQALTHQAHDTLAVGDRLDSTYRDA